MLAFHALVTVAEELVTVLAPSSGNTDPSAVEPASALPLLMLSNRTFMSSHLVGLV